MALADVTMCVAPFPPMLISLWQCDIGDHKWVDYPADINQKLEAVYNNTNSEATQSVQYVWPEDGPEGGQIVYHIYPKGSPWPIQLNSRSQQMRKVRRAFLEKSCKGATPAMTGEPAPKGPRTI